MIRNTVQKNMLAAALLWLVCAHTHAADLQGDTFELPAAVLEDKIRGGLLGQLLGNLNGLPHEFKYLQKPGSVTDYTPALPQGARTDDDTDIEWVYVFAMEKADTLFISPARITQLWKTHINDHIWCATATPAASWRSALIPR